MDYFSRIVFHPEATFFRLVALFILKITKKPLRSENDVPKEDLTHWSKLEIFTTHQLVQFSFRQSGLKIT